MGEFKFPANRKAAEATVFQQAQKVLEEAEELKRSVDNFDDNSRVLVECFDVINACEGVLRKYPKEERARAHDAVREKCKRRGDYEYRL